MSALHINRPN